MSRPVSRTARTSPAAGRPAGGPATRRSRSGRPRSTQVRRTPHLQLVPGAPSPARPVSAGVAAGPRVAPGASGVRVVHVGEHCECDGCDAPSLPVAERFGYTVGLTGLGEPELLLRGQDALTTARVLGHWAEAVTEGDRLAAGHLLCEGPDGRRWELREVPRAADTLLWTAHYYRRPSAAPIRALELVPTDRPCRCEES